ncbi:MAG: hypothetical protein R6U92_08320, partial [Bacillota bacterium]
MLQFRPIHRRLISAMIAILLFILSGSTLAAVDVDDLVLSDREQLSEHFALMLAAELTREDREELDRNIAALEGELVRLRERIEYCGSGRRCGSFIWKRPINEPLEPT